MVNISLIETILHEQDNPGYINVDIFCTIECHL